MPLARESSNVVPMLRSYSTSAAIRSTCLDMSSRRLVYLVETSSDIFAIFEAVDFES